MKEFILSAVFIALAAIGGLASRFIFKKKPDNFVEEFAEKIIKDKTGVNIDLSPGSKDPDNFYVIDVSDTMKKKDQKKEE
jgi:hypothetical protein